MRDNTAIFFYSSARFFINPLWKITNNWIESISLYKDDEVSTAKKVISISKSVFISIFLLPFAFGGLALGQVLHFSAYLLSTTPFIHLKGKAKEKKIEKKFSIFQQNCCLTAGGFSRLFGGTIVSNDQRVGSIIGIIQKNNADLVCLQEVSDLNDSFTLYKKLSNEFTVFYFNIGSTPFILQNNSGLFIASKVAIKEPELHSFSDVKTTETMVNKCYFLFSTNFCNFVSTHLSPSKDDLHPAKIETDTRAEEQKRIYSAIEKRFSRNKKPSYIAGDFNINWNSPEYNKSLLFVKGIDQYNQNRKEVLDQDATCETEYLVSRNWHHKKDIKPQRMILDYFLSFFSSEIPRTYKISTFDINASQNAISDHAALKTDIDLI